MTMFRKNDSASFIASTHREVFRFCTRSTSVCCNHSCKNLCFVIMQKLCSMQHVVTIFTACPKIVSNLFAIHWKRSFQRPNAFSTTTHLMLSAKSNLALSGWDCHECCRVSWANFPKNMLNHQVLRDSILHYRFVLACL